jgi:hypothetical protein
LYSPGDSAKKKFVLSVQNTLDKKDSTKNYFVDSHKKVHGKKTYLLSTLVLAHDKELFCCVLFLTDGKNICSVCVFCGRRQNHSLLSAKAKILGKEKYKSHFE